MFIHVRILADKFHTNWSGGVDEARECEKGQQIRLITALHKLREIVSPSGQIDDPRQVIRAH